LAFFYCDLVDFADETVRLLNLGRTFDSKVFGSLVTVDGFCGFEALERQVVDSVDFTGSVWCLVGVGIFGSFVDHGNEVL